MLYEFSHGYQIGFRGLEETEAIVDATSW